MKQGRGSTILPQSAKRIGRLVSSLALMAAMFLAGIARAEEEEAAKKLAKALVGIRFGLLAYLDYSAGEMPLPDGQEQNYNRFAVTRGYFRFSKDFKPWLGAHLTTDVSQETKDAQESLSGSYVVRLKYYYAELRPADFGPFTQMRSEIGMGHIPWLDFEEHVNPYRCQGTMAIERAGVFNSADLGLSLRGNLAGRLEEAENKTGNKHDDGRYGSWHLGGYNGGGYAAEEKNQNKVIEGRLTLRPLPSVIPGLQLSYFGLYGEGNRVKGEEIGGITLTQVPAYVVHLGMLSYEHPWLTLTGQYFITRGNAPGAWVDTGGKVLDTMGYSGFFRLTLPGTRQKLSAFGRYDYFDGDADQRYSDQAAYRMWLAGLAYDIYQGNLLLADYETTDYQDDSGGKTQPPVIGNDLGHETRWQVVLQIKL